MANAPNNGIVLYHYSFSPYARRVIWYLALRGIDYAECKQPPTMPRPDVKALGVNYRRIPLCAIGKDVYCDTRLILRKIEAQFPQGALGATNAEQRAMEKLLEVWTVEAGVFVRGSQLIPADTPIVKDEKFQKDREDFSGRKWSKEAIEANRPEALAAMRNAFSFLETTLLADGRDWVFKGDGPSLADIEAVWVFDWMRGLKGALDPDLISAKIFPKVFAWLDRFNGAVTEAKKRTPKPTTLKGNAATERVLNAKFVDGDIGVNTSDPLRLTKGQMVEVWPTDSGIRHRDRGSLIGLDDDEVVIEAGTGIRVHFPRSGFRVAAVGDRSKL